jgi:hypothetical protein
VGFSAFSLASPVACLHYALRKRAGKTVMLLRNNQITANSILARAWLDNCGGCDRAPNSPPGAAGGEYKKRLCYHHKAEA